MSGCSAAGSGEGGTGAAPRACPPRLGRSAEVPKETVEKYGLTRDFAGIARLRWDYHLSEKAAHLRADNRASPTASLKRERKEPPGKRQTGETGRRKPPGRRIRM